MELLTGQGAGADEHLDLVRGEQLFHQGAVVVIQTSVMDTNAE
jgi:hypothetical protein